MNKKSFRQRIEFSMIIIAFINYVALYFMGEITASESVMMFFILHLVLKFQDQEERNEVINDRKKRK